MRPFTIPALLFCALSVAGQQTPPAATPAAGAGAAPAAQAAAPAASQEADEFSKAAFFGKKFFEMGEYGSAYEQFAKADSLRADQPAVLYDMALILAKSGRYTEAQVKVDRYNQLYPAGAEKPLVSKLQLELEFQRELQKKRESDEDYTQLFNRGKFLYTRNDLDGALKAFQEAEQQRPKDPAAVFNQAVVYEKQGEFAKASERFRRYAELEPDSEQKASVDQRIFGIDNELEDMKTKIVCPFCGLRLSAGTTWCHRCWHGTYTNAATWNSRPCVDGATATRSTYYSDSRLQKNEPLPCIWQGGTLRQSLAYTPARRRTIQDARRAEGWTYNGDFLQSWTDSKGNQVRFVQGPERLEKIVSPTTGEFLLFEAHKAADGTWLLDREDTIIEGQKYTSHYAFDDKNRIIQQQVSFQNAAACNHLIDMTADYVYQNDALASATIKGGYTGSPAEGAPQTAWQTAIVYAYDPAGRLTKEDLNVTSFTKVYTQKPAGALREDISKLYLSMRVKRPIENANRSGDLCGTTGNLLVSNPIDLRPFYALSPNLAITLNPGVVHAVVSFTYPESYSVR